MGTDLSSSKADKAFNIVKAVAGLEPITGFFATLVNDFIPSEVSKRRDALLLRLEEDFKNLSDRINNEMISKPYFISIFMQSFRSAMATEKQEKIDSYRAIILNTLIAQNPDTDSLEMMIKITDSLTPLHIKLLKVFNNPQIYLDNNPDAKTRFGNIYMGGLSHLVRACFPSYPQDLISVALKDLESIGLGNGLNGGATMTVQGILQSRLTDFGRRYLTFITPPNFNYH